jgi:hypothetical protein
MQQNASSNKVSLPYVSDNTTRWLEKSWGYIMQRSTSTILSAADDNPLRAWIRQLFQGYTRYPRHSRTVFKNIQRWVSGAMGSESIRRPWCHWCSQSLFYSSVTSNDRRNHTIQQRRGSRRNSHKRNEYRREVHTHNRQRSRLLWMQYLW